MSRDLTKPVCSCCCTKEEIRDDYKVKLADRCAVCIAIDPSCTALVGAHPSHKSPPAPAAPPLPRTAPAAYSSHVAVIDASDLAMEEKYELKYFCAEQVNWAQAQRIGQMAVTSGLAEELRNLLGFLRKKYQDQLAAAVASASASASKSKNQKLEHMKSRMID